MGSFPVTYKDHFCVSANVYGEAIYVEKKLNCWFSCGFRVFSNLIVGFRVFSCL